MMFGMGSNAELTRKYERVKVQNDIRTSKHINKQTSPIFNCVTLRVSRSPIILQVTTASVAKGGGGGVWSNPPLGLLEVNILATPHI